MNILERKKGEFKDLLSLATKESYFIFNSVLYKQIKGVAMRFTLGAAQGNVFLAYHEQNWLPRCPFVYKP